MMLRLFVATCFVGVLNSVSFASDRILLPRLKPQSLQMAPGNGFAPPNAQEGGEDWPAAEVTRERAKCRALLKGLDLDYADLSPIGQPGGCGSPAPVLLKAVAGVAIEPPAEANCEFAAALHGWVASAVKPAAASHLSKKLGKIHNASAYVCRRRNNSATGKLSEHAIANALDISTLGFDDGSSVNIKGDWSGLLQMIGLSSQGAFLRQIRQYACVRFTTVLGPGTDPYHGDHFHVDLARRRGGYRICN